MPFSAAEATKRRTKSPPTGREPTRKRPRSASPSGVVVRLLSARMRSQGLSTPRRTAESKTPPPETSRHANPALSSTSASDEQLGGRDFPRQRFLREQADSGVYEPRHERSLPSAAGGGTLCFRNTSHCGPPTKRIAQSLCQTQGHRREQVATPDAHARRAASARSGGRTAPARDRRRGRPCRSPRARSASAGSSSLPIPLAPDASGSTSSSGMNALRTPSLIAVTKPIDGPVAAPCAREHDVVAPAQDLQMTLRRGRRRPVDEEALELGSA